MDSIDCVLNKFCYIKIYRSVYKYIDSNMYVLPGQNEAVIIDPHKDAEIEELLKKNNISNIFIILTHEHCDHISGLSWLQGNFQCSIICSEICAEKIADKKNTRPLFISFALQQEDLKNGTHRLEDFNKNYIWTTYKADITFSNKFEYHWQNHTFVMYPIRGHSDGSCIIMMDKKFIFTGDSLLQKYPIIVSFPTSDKNAYINETLPFLEKILTPEMTILPGHGNMFLLKEILKEGKINVELKLVR